MGFFGTIASCFVILVTLFVGAIIFSDMPDHLQVGTLIGGAIIAHGLITKR